MATTTLLDYTEAAMHGNIEAVDILLDQNTTPPEHILSTAIRNKQPTSFLSQLLDRGFQDSAAAELSIISGQYESFDMLTRRGVKLDVQKCFMAAARKRDTRYLSRLLELKYVPLPPVFNETVIHNNPEGLKLLFTSDVLPDAVIWTFVIWHNNPKCFQILIDNRLQPNAQHLRTAIENNKFAMINRLLEHQCPIDDACYIIASKFGFTTVLQVGTGKLPVETVEMAITHHRYYCLEYLLKSGRVNFRNAQFTMYAVERSPHDTRYLYLLLQHGCPVHPDACYHAMYNQRKSHVEVFAKFATIATLEQYIQQAQELGFLAYQKIFELHMNHLLQPL